HRPRRGAARRPRSLILLMKKIGFVSKLPGEHAFGGTPPRDLKAEYAESVFACQLSCRRPTGEAPRVLPAHSVVFAKRSQFPPLESAGILCGSRAKAQGPADRNGLLRSRARFARQSGIGQRSGPQRFG